MSYAHLRNAYIALSIFVGIAASTPACAQQYGLDRSNLIWSTPAAQSATLSGIASLGVSWFRDGFSGANATSIGESVNEIAMAKSHNLNVLVVVTQQPTDYDSSYVPPNAGPGFVSLCGWSGGSYQISQINIAKLTQRLVSELTAVKMAGWTIDAFELGNEIDWMCFNGDVPNGHLPSPAELRTLVLGYERFIFAAGTIIQSPLFFPKAKLITAGLANIPNSWDVGHHVPNPSQILADIKIDGGGFYLRNFGYHIDGVGEHYYPGPTGTYSALSSLLSTAYSAAGLPVWLTEWGYNANAFPTPNGTTRAMAMAQFYQWLESIQTPVGPNFCYAYSEYQYTGFGLVQSPGQVTPETVVVQQYAQPLVERPR